MLKNNNSSVIKKIIYPWDEFNDDVNEILKIIKNNKWKFSCVFGIPKGGLPLAVCLANHLHIRLIQSLPLYLGNKNILIVEDISDTGTTLKDLIPRKFNVKVITLFIKEKTKYIPDYYCNKIKRNIWPVFPWEPYEKATKRDNTIFNNK